MIQINFIEEQLEVLELVLTGFVDGVEDSEFDSTYISSDAIKMLKGIRNRVRRALKASKESEGGTCEAKSK